VNKQKRPGRNVTHLIVGAKVVHALCRLSGKFHNRSLAHAVTQFLGDRHDVIAWHHQRFPSALAVALPFLQHIGETRPRLRRRMLAAEFALAVSPTAAGNHGGDALVRSTGEYGNRSAEAATHQSDTSGIHFRARSQVADCVARIGDLIEANNSSVLALAFAASPKVDAHGYITPLAELLSYDTLALAILVAAEAVEHDKCGVALAGTEIVRCMDDAG